MAGLFFGWKNKYIPIEIEGDDNSDSSEELLDGDLPADISITATAIKKINIRYFQDEYNYHEAYLPDVQMRDTEDPFKHTELVLKFDPNILPEALIWFISRVTANKSDGGAELLIKREPYFGYPNESLVIHVTAKGWRLLEIAEKLEIVKKDYLRNTLRPFKLIELNSFLNDSMDMSDILTPAEKQIAVMHELQNFFVYPGEEHIPGYKHMKLTITQSVLHAFLQRKLIISFFALHNAEDLNKLAGKWFKTFWDKRPYEVIRSYFGDGTCLYFNFVAYYTWHLVPAALVGLVICISPESWMNPCILGACIFNMIHVTLFLILWQRYQSSLAFRWGTLKMANWEPARDNHYGVLGHDPVTGRIQRLYPSYKVRLKTYLVSCPLVIAWCGVAIWCMFIHVECDEMATKYADEKLKNASGFLEKAFWKFGFIYITPVVYGIVITILTKLYRQFSEILTEWENHRTETQFERHLVYKMVIFEISNGFSLLLYTAFILRDIELLKTRIYTLLSISQLILIAEQCFLPILFRTGILKMKTILEQNSELVDKVFYKHDLIKKTDRMPRPYPGLEKLSIETMDLLDHRVQMSKIEEYMAPYRYQEDFNEYLNLYNQFGYLYMFASLYPLAGTFAVICNLCLLQASLFKRREVYQRALAKRVKNIGAWQDAFEFTGTFSVVTNCALLSMNESVKKEFPEWTQFEFFVAFVMIEHVILLLQYIVKRIVPKIPNRVKVALARDQYKSSLALKREKATFTRRRMGQVFQAVRRTS